MKKKDLDLFTKSQKTLIRFSGILEAVSRVILVAYVLMLLFELLSLVTQNGPYSGIDGGLSNDILLDNLIRVLKYFLKGVVYWFALKGIALGLDVLTEIDINQEDLLQGESDE